MGEGTGRGVEPSGAADADPDHDAGVRTGPGLLLRRLVPVRRSERTEELTAGTKPTTRRPPPADPGTAEPGPAAPGTNGHGPDHDPHGPEAGTTDVFTPDDGPDRWGPDDWGLDGLLVARVVAVASALVAVVCGVLLPFAPVVQNHPENPLAGRRDAARADDAHADRVPTAVVLRAVQLPGGARGGRHTRRLRAHDDVPDVERLRRQGAVGAGARRRGDRAQRRPGHRRGAAPRRGLLLRRGRGGSPG